jgi:hypothetical protein
MPPKRHPAAIEAGSIKAPYFVRAAILFQLDDTETGLP